VEELELPVEVGDTLVELADLPAECFPGGPLELELGLQPGHRVEFAVIDDGQVVMHKAGAGLPAELDRFDRATGCADIRWRTDELMKLLRN
jgi:hypothetical protein